MNAEDMSKVTDRSMLTFVGIGQSRSTYVISEDRKMCMVRTGHIKLLGSDQRPFPGAVIVI